MSSDDAIVKLLQSIDGSLKTLVARSSGGAKSGRGQVATAADMRDRYGDPTLRYVPRDWIGADYKGQPFSACPPDLLDIVAEMLDDFADKDEATGRVSEKSGKPTAPFKRKDAALARAWAARNREHPPESKPAATTSFADDDGGDTEIPFAWFGVIVSGLGAMHVMISVLC